MEGHSILDVLEHVEHRPISLCSSSGVTVSGSSVAVFACSGILTRMLYSLFVIRIVSI